MDKVVLTADGSNTLYSDRFEEHYHSTNGALQESQHVFIEAGLSYIRAKKLDRLDKQVVNCRILEYGFGSGLNALLSYNYSQVHAYSMNYLGFEAYPIPVKLLERLNYTSLIGTPELESGFRELHRLEQGSLSDQFHYRIKREKFAPPLPPNSFELVFFDAFSPERSPDCWEPWVFELMHSALRPGGCLVTYCAKGVVRRTMQTAGFEVERLPGPPGKREILRATKI